MRIWMVPKLQIYAGDPEPLADSPASVHFWNIHRIAYLDDPALPEAVNRHWVVADDFGIQLVSLRGEIRPWLGAASRRLPGPNLAHLPFLPGAFSCRALAARPATSAASNPYHLVYSETPAHSQAGPSPQIFALEPDGSRRLLAGVPGITGFRDGPGAKALFGEVVDLAMDREGDIYVLDRGNRALRLISPEGQVSTLAGGPRAKGPFIHPMAMALDAKGNVYVADTDGIHRLAPGGELRRILGAGDRHGSLGAMEPPPHDPAPRMPSDPINGVHLPGGLGVHGRNLFIADTVTCTIRVLDLDTGTLHTLAGSPEETRTRRGPLGYYVQGRPPAECAALAYPGSIAFSTDGICVVGVGTCLAELDMPPFVSPARADLADRRDRNGKDYPGAGEGAVFNFTPKGTSGPGT